MSVQVNIPQFLQHTIGDVEVVKVSGRTVGQCLNDLVRQFPQLESKLFKSDGKFLPYLEVYVNGQATYPQELKMPVSDGDELRLISVLVGG